MAFDGGTGTALDPYLVSTPAQLNDVRNYLTSFFLQTANIDLTGITWVSIASNLTFSGGYDGANFNITNLVINEPASTGFTGLFSYVTGVGSYLKNIHIVDCNVLGKNSVGALCGYFNGDLVQNCHASGSVSGRGPVGGLLGKVAQYIFNSAYVVGTVEHCSSSCSVFTSIEDSDYAYNFGGFVGYTNSCHYIGCSATGSVHGDDSVGGFVGYGGGISSIGGTTYLNCYATGNIDNTWAVGDTYGTVGAFVGYCTQSHFTNCYASGTVLSDSMSGTNLQVGGFYAFAVGVVATTPTTTLVNCFYDVTHAPPFDYDVDYPYDEAANPTATAAMKLQETFTGWDFDTTWILDPAYNDGYPAFVYQVPIVFYANATHYVKQNGQWVEVTEPKAYTTTDVADFETAVVTLVDTALDTLLGASY